MKKHFKIVDRINGQIQTLFHGINGAKQMPLNAWVEANIKMVRDSKNGPEYLSGFHVLETVEGCKNYLRRFKNLKHKDIVPCFISGKRKKAHSKSKVFLADKIFFIEE